MKSTFWNITAQGKEAEIDIFGVIGDMGLFAESTLAADFMKEVRRLGRSATALKINVHSPGGSVLDGLAMYRAIREFQGKKVSHVPALAASIATVVALAADEVIVAPEALWAIHNPMADVRGGNEADLLEIAKLLSRTKEQLLDIYERRTGQPRAKLSAAMDDEARYVGEEIKAAGFADTVKADQSKVRLAACSLDILDHWKRPPVPVRKPMSAELAARYKKVKAWHG